MSQKFRSWQRPPMAYDENWATWVTSVLNSLAPAAVNSNLLNFQGPAAASTGTGAAKIIYTFVLPANTLAIGKGIRITAVVNHNSGAASVTYTVKFGATSVVANSTANNTGVNVFKATVFATGSVAQISYNETIFNATPTSGLTTPAESISGNIPITVSFNVANTDQVTPEMFIVELIQ